MKRIHRRPFSASSVIGQAAVVTGVAFAALSGIAFAQTTPTPPPAASTQESPATPAQTAPAPAPGAEAPTPASPPTPSASQGAPPPQAPPPPPPSERMPPQMQGRQGFPPSMPPPPPSPPTAAQLKPGKAVTLPATLSISGVAAIVNGQKITNEDVVREFLSDGAQPTLNTLVTQMELEQAAAKHHVTVTPAEISKRLDQTKIQFLSRSPGQTWSDVLASRGLSEVYARNQTRMEILVEKLATINTPFTLTGKIHVYHILIATTQLPMSGTPHTDADAKKLVDQIRADVVAHKTTFQKAAEKYSDDKGTAVKGGDLGWVSQSDPLDPAFKQSAFSIKEGQIGEPVKSQYGWHIIYVSQLGAHATAEQVSVAGDDSLSERARPFVGQYVQQLQASAKVQNILIPTPPAAHAAPLPASGMRVPIRRMPAPGVPPTRPAAPGAPKATGGTPPPPPL